MPRLNHKPDHQGAAHVVIPDKPDLSYVHTLSETLRNTPAKTILRATTANAQQIIYLRRAPKTPALLRTKNRAEIAANRVEMRKVLAEIVASFEEKKCETVTKRELAAAKILTDLAATRHGDITAADIREPLGIMSAKLAHTERLLKARKASLSSPANKTVSRETMLRRFDCMDEVQKNNLKKMLFPPELGIHPLKQDFMLSQMQVLVGRLRKHPDARPSELAKKFCDLPNLERFVHAWFLFRPDGSDKKTPAPRVDHQFSWRRTMDTICTELKNSLFPKAGGTASGKSSPVPLPSPLVDTPLSPVGRAIFKPRHKNTSHKTQIHRKRLFPGTDETALEALIKKAATPDGKVSPPLAPRRYGQINTTNNDSRSLAADSPSSPSLPGLLRQTESGILEHQIMKFDAAQARARANGDLARLRLQALLESRLAFAANAVAHTVWQPESALVSPLVSDAKDWTLSGALGELAAIASLDAGALRSDDPPLLPFVPGLRHDADADEEFASLQTVARTPRMAGITVDPVALPLPADVLFSLPDDGLDGAPIPASFSGVL